jgi:hypothetical protein
MQIDAHVELALRIEATLGKLGDADYEMRIEGAMLAGTHWLNVLLHRVGANPPAQDVFHTYLLTINEFRRLAVAADRPMHALAEIEDIRPPYVRGNAPGGELAAARALDLLARLRAEALDAA